MFSNDNDVQQTARALVARHGVGARQLIVDRIIDAIRSHDLISAKRWDAVGQLVDRQLAA